MNPELERCVHGAVEAALNKKGFQIVGLDVSSMTSLADVFLICSGAGERQVGAITDAIVRRLKEEGRRPLHVEGERQAQWVLIDYGDLVVHVFTEERRSFYALEKLWSEAVKLDFPGNEGPAGEPR